MSLGRIAKYPPAKDGRKWCFACDRELDVSEFNKTLNARDGFNPCCKQCKSLKERARKYGLSVEQVLEIINQPCAICGKDGEHIDHCHETLVVRGYLCNNCNLALGLIKDNAEHLLKAANYLERSVV